MTTTKMMTGTRKAEGSSSSIHFATDNNCSGTVLNVNSLLGKKTRNPNRLHMTRKGRSDP